MSLYDKLWNVFSLEDRSINELLKISSLIDRDRSNPGFLKYDNGELAEIASVIVALINEQSTADVGNRLYASISELIVKQNLSMANANNGKKLYEELMQKQDIGKYTIQRHSHGYRFILKASSGEVLAVSELYSKVESCLSGIEAVRKNSSGEIDDLTQEKIDKVSHPKFELYIDKVGEYRFRLKARNGEIIAISEGYRSKQACLNAIESVKRNSVSEYIEKA